jgi:hypothetical protein
MRALRFFLFAGILVLNFCRTNPKVNKSAQIENVLALDVPDNFKITTQKGLDSYVFEISNDIDLTFFGNLGYFPDKLEETAFPVFPLALKDSIIARGKGQLNSSNVFFSDNPDVDYKLRVFSRQFYFYDTLNGILVRIVHPKKIGNGITGIYVPKLRDGRSLSLYGENLDSTKHKLALEIFRTLHYLKE